MFRSTGKYFGKKQELGQIHPAEAAIIESAKLIRYCQIKRTLPIDTHIHDDIENPYSNRIIDTLARFFYIEDGKPYYSCCAVGVIEKDGSTLCYLSYNTPIKPTTENKVKGLYVHIRQCQDYRELIDYCLANKHYFYCKESQHYLNTHEKFFGELWSDTFGQFPADVSADDAQLNQQIKRLIKTVYESMPKNFAELQARRQGIEQAQQNIFALIQDSTYPEEIKSKAIEAINTYIARKFYFWNRLEQDCKKILRNIDSSILKDLEVENIALIDSDNIHCELNIRERLKNEGFYPSYIGVSKLCCYTCDTQLDADERKYGTIVHLGGSGIAYPIDGLPNSIITDPELILFRSIGRFVKKAQRSEQNNDPFFLDSTLQYREQLSPIDEVLTPTPVHEENQISGSHGSIYYITDWWF